MILFHKSHKVGVSKGRNRETGTDPFVIPRENHVKEITMQDRNKTTQKSFAELWMDGFREVAEARAEAADHGVDVSF